MTVKLSEKQKQEYTQMALEALHTPAETWYKSPCCSKSRADIFAECILKNNGLARLEAIETIKRERPYFVGHDGKTKNETSNRLEERIALDMFHKEYPLLGKIVDYQVPLKKTSADKGLGKIDLIAYHATEKTLTLLELKKPDSNEMLLRAVLEIFTYSKQVAAEKLKKEFREKYSLPPDLELTIRPAVLLFEDSWAYQEYQKQKSATCRLMNSLKVGFHGLRLRFGVEPI